MIDLLTAELGELVADATALPTSIDPVRPPQVPGCYIGPPSIQPDADTGGRLVLVQWEVGAVVPAATGAWSSAAGLGESITAAIIGHPTLALISARSMLSPHGDGGSVPGYRIDVAVLIAAAELAPLTPTGRLTFAAIAALTVSGTVLGGNVVDGAATLIAAATLAAAGAAVGINVVDGAATLTAPATLTAAGTVVTVPVIDGAATLTAPATLTAAGTVVGSWSPPAIAGLTGWWTADDPATLIVAGSPSRVSTWLDKSPTVRPLTNATAVNQPITGTRTIGGRNALDCYISQLAATTGIVQPFTVAAVVQYDLAVMTNGQWWGYPYTAVGQKAGSYNLYAGLDLVAGTIDTGPHVWIAVLNGAQSGIYIDGAASPVVSGDAGALGVPLVYVGGDQSIQAYLDGLLGEVVLYASALGATDRAALADYLKRWGTP